MSAPATTDIPGARNGLSVDARVHRGAFTLEVTVDVEPGSVVAVLGPNGAGKSTLLRAVAGLTPVSTGRIRLGGVILDESSSGRFIEPSHRDVGFVFQDYRLFPHLSVLDNVAFGPLSAGSSRATARGRAGHWLGRLSVADLAHRRPAELSGGQAQRVALARALAAEPALLLLDEPMAALDAQTRQEVQGQLREHLVDFRGPCVIVTHDPLEALLLADRLIVLEAGRVTQDGTAAQVGRRPATEYVARLLGLNLFAGHADHERVTLASGGTFVVPDHGQRGPVLVAVRPSSVTVATARPEGSSARNVWAGTVTGLSLLADRVRLEVTGQPAAWVDVSPGAVADLGLRPGTRVWLSVKATDLEVYQRTVSPVRPL